MEISLPALPSSASPSLPCPTGHCLSLTRPNTACLPRGTALSHAAQASPTLLPLPQRAPSTLLHLVLILSSVFPTNGKAALFSQDSSSRRTHVGILPMCSHSPLSSHSTCHTVLVSKTHRCCIPRFRWRTWNLIKQISIC